jgi:hypothetical protein
VLQLAEQRQLILEQQNNSVSKPLLVILIFALAVNFLSFGLFAPRNALSSRRCFFVQWLRRARYSL